MSTSTDPDRLIDLIGALDPEQAAAPITEARREEIRARASRDRSDAPPSKRASRRRLALRSAVVATLGAAGIVALFLGGNGGLGPGSAPQFAEAAIRVAEANPRLLVEAPGWSVANAYAFSKNSGDLRFSNGEDTLDLTWYPARFYQGYLDDRAHVSDVDKSVSYTHLTLPTNREV